MPNSHQALDLPLLLTDEVVHLGTLDIARRGEQHASSQEGHALSVSHAPHAWQRIARLGGEPLQVLTRPNGQFVDALELLRNPAWEAVLDAWAGQEGLIERVPRWRAWIQDQEADDWRFTVHTTPGEALVAIEDDTGDDATLATGPGGKPAVEAVQERWATPALAQRLGLPDGPPMYNVQDLVLLAWVDAHLPEVDGVWWTNTYDPYGHSAPRGGLFPDRLTRWAVTPGHLATYTDDEDGLRMNVDVRPLLIDSAKNRPMTVNGERASTLPLRRRS